MGCSLEDATLPTLLACLSKAAAEGVALGLNVPVQPTGKATRGAVIARVGEGRWLYPPALFAAAGTAAVPAQPSKDDVLGHDGAGEAAPEDGVGKDHTDEDAGSTADNETEALPLDDPDDDAPEAEEPPAVPVRRRRSRRDSGEARAVA